VDVSIVIRTYNEQRYLPELLSAISSQQTDFEFETVIVDSGSTDGTLEIADQFGCRVSRIPKHEFTFGRSLNIGCEAANGKVLVFISGHCVPCNTDWLAKLVDPVLRGTALYSYGRQVGRDTTKFSERQVFSKYYPEAAKAPQDGFFCNNANAALSHAAWETHKFDESLTGLEDMKLAKIIFDLGESIAYVLDAPVFHIHDESWHQVRIRYEREALALREIMPEVHIGFADFLRYFFSGVLHDFGVALEQRAMMKHAGDVIAFRWMQFWGTYRGNLEHRQISARQREEYFYPRPARRKLNEQADSRSSTYESS
jgi:glycosyltransferase involved in cell wall biosynthesis